MKRLQKHLTTSEQSERLVKLGLPTNSADFYYNCFMHLYPVPKEGYDKWVDGEDGFTPCWSVGRLMEIIDICDTLDTGEEYPTTKQVKDKCKMSYVEYMVGTIENMAKLREVDFSKLEEKNMEPAEGTPKQINEFHVGQRVNVPHLSKHGTITEVRKYGVIVKFDGECSSVGHDCSFAMVEPINEEYPEFKPFDKVLVRDFDKDAWRPRLYSRKGNMGYCTQDNYEYAQILPYEGNEYLAGTNIKPKK